MRNSVGVALRLKVTGHLRLDGRVDHAIKRADPFPLDRNVTLLYWRYYDIRWRRTGLPSVALARLTTVTTAAPSNRAVATPTIL